MDIFVLVGQRAERYVGEYAPEALAVIDEYGNDDNPVYMKEQKEKYYSSGEFVSLAVLQLGIQDDAVTSALFPETGKIPCVVRKGA